MRPWPASRQYVEEVAAGMLDFGILLSSKLSATTHSLLAKIRGDQTGDDMYEEVDDCSIFGHAAIDWRPADPTGDDACEVLMWRRGDELVGLATLDRRWQVQVEAGEVAIHAFGDDAPTILLKPNGDVTVSNANGSIALASGGNVTINGVVIDTDGNITAPGEVTAMDGPTSVSLSTHKHGTAMGPSDAPTPGT
ncbi:MAG: hypothetical protein KC619_31890 [Myxococcales bacterium]|nr:hypothetical protein [Myxococcales bacterium]